MVAEGSRHEAIHVLICALIGFAVVCTPLVGLHGIEPWSWGTLNATASPDDYEINICIDVVSISTLNPFFTRTLSEQLATWSCYSKLLMNDVDGTGYVGDLA